MLTANAITVLINSLTLSLALGFLLMVLWHDASKELNQFYAFFLLFVIIWTIGSLFVQSIEIISDVSSVFSGLSIGILELGFTGSSISIYILVTVLAGIRSQQFRFLSLLSLGIVIGLRILLIVITPLDINSEDTLTYQFNIVSVSFYLLFDLTTLYVTWRYRRRLRSVVLISGIIIFLGGQSLVFFNQEIFIASLATSVSSIGVLLISVAILQREIITPLRERNSQVETLHNVSLAITRELSIDTVLNEIAKQAAGWVDANGVGIFLSSGEKLELVNVYQLPQQLLYAQIMMGEGVVGTVAKTRQSLFLENYVRDWKGKSDFPLALKTFGSVICVPLIYLEKIIGVILVVSGHQGRLFGEDDVHSMELLAAQAAVAIAHGRVFTEQRRLAQQLETLLTSTENPVVAIDRKFSLIFANSAARRILPIEELGEAEGNILSKLDKEILPRDFLHAIREMYHKNSYVYDVVINDKVFQCHVAILGRPRINGWVAVLNDVTQLIELDRLKSEMVRMASHDLKNPLMGAMANIELLKDDLSEDEELRSIVSTVENQLERMNRIISGILDAERYKMGLHQHKPCDPADLVNGCLDELSFLISDKQVRIIVSIEDNLSSFYGDCQQFGRALINLVENAIKFTLYDGVVRIAVESSSGMLVFSVQDNGVGIPAELHDRVFDRFYRGNQEGVQHVSGTGLGLSLVKTVVENHSGKIWLESEPNVGTTFFVSVPIVEDSISHSHENSNKNK
ncbi:MAG: GAF domain-containing sensor histidine kinase [Aggregatilineales bacterium]